MSDSNYKEDPKIDETQIEMCHKLSISMLKEIRKFLSHYDIMQNTVAKIKAQCFSYVDS
jgi:hypothetical protein